MQRSRANVLSIAGFDPCGGAGVLADIKTFEQLRVYGMSVITAITVQTEEEFLEVQWQEIDQVLKGIIKLFTRYEINVVKIGIVRDFNYLSQILNCIKQCNSKAFIIWDPVLKSSSGFDIYNQSTVNSLRALLKDIDLVTPNYNEYLLLEPLFKEGNFKALLLKGGHRADQPGTDILMVDNNKIVIKPSVNTVFQKHGSGCVLASAVAAYIACGNELGAACRLAKLYIEQFMNSNTTLLGYHSND